MAFGLVSGVGLGNLYIPFQIKVNTMGPVELS